MDIGHPPPRVHTSPAATPCRKGTDLICIWVARSTHFTSVAIVLILSIHQSRVYFVVITFTCLSVLSDIYTTSITCTWARLVRVLCISYTSTPFVLLRHCSCYLTIEHIGMQWWDAWVSRAFHNQHNSLCRWKGPIVVFNGYPRGKANAGKGSSRESNWREGGSRGKANAGFPWFWHFFQPWLTLSYFHKI